MEKDMSRRLKGFTDLIKDELNIKQLVLATKERELVSYEILPLPHMLGKKYGKLFAELCTTVAGMDADTLVQKLKKEQSVKVEVEGKIIILLPQEVEVRTRPKEDYVLEEEQGIIVGVYSVVTEELKREGLAREIVRRIQNQRKDAGFDISDQIEIYHEAGAKLNEVFITQKDYIASETLAVSIQKAEPPEGAHVENYKINGEALRTGLVRVKHT